ncbi:hypothetical protein D6851_07830 [Altericroceibacterium spongiae]|uniref:SH3 domain-containing protein n=1 Tax=Altericroceibacterium spongiae TaxID=2320269 RepID=A0A420EMF3_9SPHN|nr:hypothetical protein [Altericroceibacterium spongiae]RKF21912.1 hypothetical protein D6851_07830 [Altericroceibacterium spongiae]
MKWPVVIALALSLQACDRHDAPADKVVKTAENLTQFKKVPDPALAKGPYAPRDECGDVKGAEEFRAKLAEVVKNRDVDGLVALSAEDIKLDFNGAAGAEELRRRLEDDEWDLWEELDTLLTLGCSTNGHGGITIPWYFEQSFDTVNPANGMLVTDENVRVMTEPHPDADTLKRISWDVVRIDRLVPDDRYQPVTLRDGEKGYVETDKLRSLLDYRLMASSRNGKWSITSFIAGD